MRQRGFWLPFPWELYAFFGAEAGAERNKKLRKQEKMRKLIDRRKMVCYDTLVTASRVSALTLAQKASWVYNYRHDRYILYLVV